LLKFVFLIVIAEPEKTVGLDNQNIANKDDDENESGDGFSDTETLALLNTAAEQTEILVWNTKLFDTFFKTICVLIFCFRILDIIHNIINTFGYVLRLSGKHLFRKIWNSWDRHELAWNCIFYYFVNKRFIDTFFINSF